MTCEFGKIWHKGAEAICIHDIRCSASARGSDLIRPAIAASLNPQMNERVILTASFSSHIFYLKMGFLPCQERVPFYWAYGCKTACEVSKYLDENSRFDEEIVNGVLYWELGKHLPEIKERDEVREISENGIPSIDHFAGQLADAIDASKKSKIRSSRDINTSGMSSINMELSDAGRKRWKEAIQQGRVFEPFRDLSHLFAAIQNPRVKEDLEQTLLNCPGFGREVFIIASQP